MDLRTEAINALDKVIASGLIEKSIETAIADTIGRLVKEHLQSYSEFGKQLSKLVAESFALNGSLDLPSYNDTLLKIIRKQVQTLTEDTIQRQVAANMEKLLTPPPASIKLSELVAAYIKHLEDKLDSGDVAYGNEITFIMDSDDGKFTYVSLDDEANKRKHECEIRFGVYKGELFSLTFQKSDIEKDMFAGPFYDFERMLFQMKAAHSKIELDCCQSDVSTSYGSHD